MSDPAPLDAADRAIVLSAETLGHDLLAALIAELRHMPDHFLRLNEKLQRETIDRLKEKIQAGAEKAISILMKAELAAVPAEVKSVSIGEYIKAQLRVQRDALYRHALADAQGKKVLVLVASPDQWMQRMDEIKARADQLDLWDQEEEAFRTQPAYRRDESPIRKGMSWAELKKSLAMKDEPKPEGDAPPASQEKPAVDTSQDSSPAEDAPPIESGLGEQREWTVGLRILQEQLSQVGVSISLGALQAHSEDELHAAQKWAEAYAADGAACQVERPTWLPMHKGDAT